MSPTPYTLLFAIALVSSLAVKLWLATRQMRHVAEHRATVPTAFTGQVSLADHQRAADYTLAKGRFGLLVMAVGHGVLLGWTLLGGFDVLNNLLRNAVEPRFGAMAYQLALLSAFALIGGAIDLPFELYSTFRLEQRFGFNRGDCVVAHDPNLERAIDLAKALHQVEGERVVVVDQKQHGVGWYGARGSVYLPAP